MQPKLLEEIEAQRQAVEEFSAAIELCKNPLPVPVVNFEPFQNLQNILQNERDEEARARRLEQAENSLELAKGKLAELEQQWANQQAEAKKQWAKFEKLLQKFNNLSEQQTLIANQLIEEWPAVATALQPILPPHALRSHAGPRLLELIYRFEIHPESFYFVARNEPNTQMSKIFV